MRSLSARQLVAHTSAVTTVPEPRSRPATGDGLTEDEDGVTDAGVKIADDGELSVLSWLCSRSSSLTTKPQALRNTPSPLPLNMISTDAMMRTTILRYDTDNSLGSNAMHAAQNTADNKPTLNRPPRATCSGRDPGKRRTTRLNMPQLMGARRKRSGRTRRLSKSGYGRTRARDPRQQKITGASNPANR
jgi:hypothetical protein